jgi:arginyl-tRNA synthetase
VQTITQQLDACFRKAIQTAFGIDVDPLIGVSQNEKFGDYQSNAAMGLAKVVAEKTGQKTNPRQVAEAIKGKLGLGDVASEVSIAGPGFINVKLSPAFLTRIAKAQATDERLGIPLASSQDRVVVDYSGPNIAKQMHVGHLRSTIIGDALANVVEVQGQHVIRQSHIGDWGTQFGMLIERLLEMGPSDAITILDLEKFYREAKQRFDSDLSFVTKARNRVVSLQKGDSETLAAWQRFVSMTRDDYLPIYGRLHVKLKVEHERGESFYNPMLPAVVAELREKGIAVESEGAIVVKVPGFEAPLIIQKSDGGYLYGTTDLAAIRFRVNELKANRIIYTHDSRQQQHFAQVFWTAKQAGWADGVSLEYAPFGTMLGEDGKPFKTRSGDTVKLKELLDEAEERALAVVESKNAPLPVEQKQAIAKAIGIGAVKYSDLSKDRISDYVFSWEKMLAMDGNTAPYLQYVYARIRSIFRKAEVTSTDPSAIVLDSSFEQSLAKHLARFGETVDAVARELKPHLLCTYLYDLATRFSSFYENCPVLKSDDATKASRLALCDLTANVMAKGLDLLGIEHPEQM